MERQENYEIECTSKATLDLNKLVLAFRRITTESEDVLETINLDGLKSVIDLLHRHVGTGEMHHGLDADHVLHPVGDVESEIGGGTTGSPSDVAECGVVSHHTLHPLEQVVHCIFSFGREELEREHHFIFPCLPDLLYYLHFSHSHTQICEITTDTLLIIIIIIIKMMN